MMKYRRFGRTELQMPLFSCGGMRYQFLSKDIPRWMIPTYNQQNLEAVIQKAIDVGICHLETARDYGTSEVQLGRILPRLTRDKIIVQTKVMPQENPQEFRQIVERSLSNLKLDHVDLLGIHGINTPELLEYTLRSGGCLDIARQLQQQGKVRFIGFSTHAPTPLIKRTIETGQFDYLNLHWYYINQDNWSAVEMAQQHDMGVFIISPTDKGGHLYNPSAKLSELCAPLSPMVFNDLFCLSHPQVHTLSLGASKVSDFDEHLKVLPLLDRAEEILPTILNNLKQEAIATLGDDWYHHWHVGLPTPEETPNQINIPVILWLRNLWLAYDMIEYAQARYNLLGNGGHWFGGQQAVGVAELDLSDCLKESPYQDIIPQLLADTHQKLAGKATKRLSKQLRLSSLINRN